MSGGVTWEQLLFVTGVIGAAVMFGFGAMLWLQKILNGMSAAATAGLTALREKVTEELRETRHTLYGRIDMAVLRLEEKMGHETQHLEGRVRDVELQIARLEGANMLAAFIKEKTGHGLGETKA